MEVFASCGERQHLAALHDKPVGNMLCWCISTGSGAVYSDSRSVLLCKCDGPCGGGWPMIGIAVAMEFMVQHGLGPSNIG